MTQRLYETDGACRRFTATVLGCEPAGEGYAVTLDRTAFFPEGGGQYADTGTLGGVAVTDVQLSGDTPVHYTAAPLPVGQMVEGVLDWDTRFARMQHHTGEHIVSGLVYATYGYHNVGFHLGHHDTTLDFDGELTRAQIAAIEQRANAVVAANLPVTVSFPSRETLAATAYRSKKELTGRVRLVSIDGVDVCACCAPHVAFTGEVGGIKVLEAARYKGGMRLHMRCGAAAMAALETLYTQMCAASAALSAKPEELSDAVARLLRTNEEQKRALAALRRELALKEADALPANQPLAAVFLAEADSDTLQRLVNAGVARGNRFTAAFAGSDDGGYTGIIGGEEAAVAALGTALRAHGGRGGGRDGRWQGKITADRATLTAFLQEWATA